MSWSILLGFAFVARSPLQRISLSATSSSTAMDALVVGGGPAGLASAWVLAQRGFDVTILERRKEPNPYEPQKAYLYLVDGRGQKFTDLAGLTDQLASPDISVSSLNYTVTRLMPDGERIVAVPPILEPMDPVRGRPSYWIPRAALLKLLGSALPPTVRKLYGSEVLDVSEDGTGIEVVAKNAEGETLRLRPDLLIGADGLQSLVRAKCAEWSGDPAGFTPKVLPSPSSGLAYKMLRFPPRFRLSTSDTTLVAEGRQAYSVRPANKGAPLGKVRLGLLPVADPAFPRTANVILPPEHPVWQLDTSETVLAWLRATFPSLPIDEIVDESEASAFASGTPGEFPAPCYSPRQHLLTPKSGTGVVLVGDAIHAFPPDIGQGVNAALASVMHLERALDQAGQLAADDTSQSVSPRDLLRRALPAYGDACAPEAEAVARIAQIGFPFQYPITRERSPFVRPLWFANFLLRTFVLSKLAPKLFSPAAIVLVQRSHLTYTQVWSMAQQTTRRLQAIAAVAVVTAAWPLLRRILSVPC